MTNPVAVSAGVIVVTVAVAAAIVIMESPEVRRQAVNLRRRFAAAMRGRRAPSEADYDEFREPMYNRPEDADGFMMSSQHHMYDRDADEINLDDDDVTEEARRRQREELNYWNAVHESMKIDNDRKAADAAMEKDAPEPPRRGSATSFDDFLKPDENAENGTYVYNSGADVHNNANSGLRRRGGEPQPESRALDSSFYTAPSSASVAGFAAGSASGLAASAFEDMSDIYSATTAADVPMMVIAPIPEHEQPLIQYDSDDVETVSSATLDCAATPVSESPMNPFHDINATQSSDEAFASIQAWAEHSNESVFSSATPVSAADTAIAESAVLPHVVPQAQQQSEPSEPSVISFDEEEDGVMTPTDSASLVGSGIDLAHDHETTSNAGSRYDVISQTDGMLTPASWSDVDSVVSDDGMHVPA